MFSKLLSVLAMSSIFLISSGAAFGQSQRDWSAVENLGNQETAIKTQNGKTTYGIIKSVGADSLVLQVAGNKSLTQNEMTINRTDIKTIRRALLFVNDRNAGKGALIGAGAGAGIAAIPALTADRNEFDGASLAGAAIILGAIGGAAVGGIAGFFIKTKHKKRDLVYKQ